MKAIIPVFTQETKRPIYLQLYDYIKESILSGEMSENEKLPSLRTLAKSLSLSLTTVTSAYEQLEVRRLHIQQAAIGILHKKRAYYRTEPRPTEQMQISR